MTTDQQYGMFAAYAVAIAAVLMFCVLCLYDVCHKYLKVTKRQQRDQMLRVANNGTLEQLLNVLRQAGIVEARSFGGDGAGSECDFDGRFLTMFDPKLLGQAIGSWIYASEDGKRARSRQVAEELAKSPLTEVQAQSFIDGTRLHEEVMLQLRLDFLAAKAELKEGQEKLQRRQDAQRARRQEQRVLLKGLKASGVKAPKISAEPQSEWD